jgi:glycerol-3-phosphate dehydrogenase
MPAPLCRAPERLAGERFDLLVVGGGISGACLAWDATLRGLRVALVDQGDFASATSAATSKLIHGGLRYLKNGEVGLVRESLRERRILATIAPHQVSPLPFLVPTYPRGNTRLLIQAGMLAYDLLAFDRNRGLAAAQRLPGHRMWSPAEVLAAEPVVRPEGLTGGARYHDCQCDPERLCVEFVLAAAELGAVVVNHARVSAVACREGAVGPVEVEDRLDGRRYQVEARMLANLAGPWADELDRLCGTGGDVALVRSKGIHLVIRRPLVRAHTLVLRTAAGRHFFVIPWRGRSLIGTTDTEYRGSMEELSVTAADEAGFLAEIQEALPAAELVPEDIVFRYAGVRPLVEADTQVYQASRRYEIVDHHRRGLRGLVTAVGGKYTTSRHLAEKLTDRVLLHLGRPAVACLTARRRLPGAPPGPMEAYVASQAGALRGLLPPEAAEHLVRMYGARHAGLVELVRAEPGLAEPVRPGRPEILAQVAFAIDREMAMSLCDILLRRTGIGTLEHIGDEALSRVEAVAARRLGWDAARIETERAAYARRVAGQPERPAG